MADFGCTSESDSFSAGDSWAVAPRLRFDAVFETDGVVGSAFRPRRPLVAGVVGKSLPVNFERSFKEMKKNKQINYLKIC